MEEKILTLNQFDAQKERVVNELIKDMVSLNMVNFERQLDLYIGQKGIDKTITEIIFLFLERVGILWVTNHINPAQEHLASNIIRQKIILGIEKLPKITQYHEKRIVLFLPEGEYHEIGILYVHFLLKQKGIYIDYLGTNTPILDLAYLATHQKIAYFYSHITSPAKSFKLNKFLEGIATQVNNVPVLISGQLLQTYKGPLASNIQLLKSLADTTDFIASL
jgi:methanogenic corrinoid protein MtbC1